MSKKPVGRPFESAQIDDPEMFHAVVAVALEVPKLKTYHPGGVAAYGIGIAGGGETLRCWAGGINNNHISLMARAVGDLLEIAATKTDKRLVVYLNAGMRDYIGPGGHVWKSDARRRLSTVWPVLAPVLGPLEAGRWEPRYWRKGSEPAGYQVAFDAANEGFAAAQESYWAQEQVSQGTLWVKHSTWGHHG
ncbi:MAG: hypothetical protein Rhirs2KO_11310 [Rhizobiaceae bacterium]